MHHPVGELVEGSDVQVRYVVTGLMVAGVVRLTRRAAVDPLLPRGLRFLGAAEKPPAGMASAMNGP